MLLLGLAGWAFGAGFARAEPVTVHLASGRSFVGEVDARTDEEQLWLRIEKSAITLWRPVKWAAVMGGAHRGAALSAAELRELAEEIKTTHTLRPWPTQSEAAVESAEFVPSVGEPILPPVPKSLALTAQVANWDADGQVDGLVVSATALDAWGYPTPVQGTLQVTLIGTRPASLHLQGVHYRGASFPQLGVWSRSVNTAFYAADAAQFKLPFTTRHPDFDFDLGAFGLVHARLAVPGQGVFEATAEFVRVRPYSPLRDYHEQLQGTRFFAIERVGR